MKAGPFKTVVVKRSRSSDNTSPVGLSTGGGGEGGEGGGRLTEDEMGSVEVCGSSLTYFLMNCLRRSSSLAPVNWPTTLPWSNISIVGHPSTPF